MYDITGTLPTLPNHRQFIRMLPDGPFNVVS